MILLRPGLPPVEHVVLGHLVRDVDVAGLPHRPAAAPLLAHEAELDARALENERDGARHRRPVEGGFAVGEEDRLAPGGNVEACRPGPHLGRRGLDVPAENGLVPPAVGELGPPLPILLVDALLDRERAHRLDHIDRPLAEAVEVAGEERVRAAQLAGTAHGAMHVILGHVLDRQVALVHRDDVGVEGGRRVALVPRDLHDRANLAAELMARAEAVVRRVPPFLDELLGRIAVGRCVRTRALLHRATLMHFPAPI